LDPTAALIRALEAMRDGDRVEAFDALQDLAGWLAKGGFLPDVYAALRELENRIAASDEGNSRQ
jgi:hypothetical protein